MNNLEVFPDYSHFKNNFDLGKNQVVYTKFSADLDTPVSLKIKLSEHKENSFLLESVTGGEIKGRFSIIGIKPDLIWKCNGTTSEINRSALLDVNAFEKTHLDPLSTIIISIE